MKNINKITKQRTDKKKKNLSYLLNSRVIITVLLIALSSPAFAQKYVRKSKTYVGAGVDNVSTGNAHGTYLVPYLIFKKGRNSFNIGPLFQRSTLEMGGGKLSFSHNLSGGKKSTRADDDDSEDTYIKEPRRQILQLNVLGFGQYISNALMSRKACMVEQKIANDGTNWSHIRLSTAEAGIGFELYVRITNRISWKNYVGGAVYYHVQYKQGMYRERVAPSLVLGTGIHICPL